MCVCVCVMPVLTTQLSGTAITVCVCVTRGQEEGREEGGREGGGREGGRREGGREEGGRKGGRREIGTKKGSKYKRILDDDRGPLVISSVEYNGEHTPAKATKNEYSKEGDKVEEVFVVPLSNAVVHPGTVVVKALKRDEGEGEEEGEGGERRGEREGERRGRGRGEGGERRGRGRGEGEERKGERRGEGDGGGEEREGERRERGRGVGREMEGERRGRGRGEGGERRGRGRGEGGGDGGGEERGGRGEGGGEEREGERRGRGRGEGGREERGGRWRGRGEGGGEEREGERRGRGRGEGGGEEREGERRGRGRGEGGGGEGGGEEREGERRGEGEREERAKSMRSIPSPNILTSVQGKKSDTSSLPIPLVLAYMTSNQTMQHCTYKATPAQDLGGNFQLCTFCLFLPQLGEPDVPSTPNQSSHTHTRPLGSLMRHTMKGEVNYELNKPPRDFSHHTPLTQNKTQGGHTHKRSAPFQTSLPPPHKHMHT